MKKLFLVVLLCLFTLKVLGSDKTALSFFSAEDAKKLVEKSITEKKKNEEKVKQKKIKDIKDQIKKLNEDIFYLNNPSKALIRDQKNFYQSKRFVDLFKSFTDNVKKESENLKTSFWFQIGSNYGDSKMQYSTFEQESFITFLENQGYVIKDKNLIIEELYINVSWY